MRARTDAERICKALEKRGIIHKQLAEHVNFSRSCVSNHLRSPDPFDDEKRKIYTKGLRELGFKNPGNFFHHKKEGQLEMTTTIIQAPVTNHSTNLARKNSAVTRQDGRELRKIHAYVPVKIFKQLEHWRAERDTDRSVAVAAAIENFLSPKEKPEIQVAEANETIATLSGQLKHYRDKDKISRDLITKQEVDAKNFNDFMEQHYQLLKHHNEIRTRVESLIDSREQLGRELKEARSQLEQKEIVLARLVEEAKSQKIEIETLVTKSTKRPNGGATTITDMPPTVLNLVSNVAIKAIDKVDFLLFGKAHG